MDTSSAPWNAPQTKRAAKRSGREPTRPTRGPAAQYPRRQARTMVWLPNRCRRRAETSMADTDPRGAPSSASPRAPSVRCRWPLMRGMWAVQEANNRPWVKNTATVADRDPRPASARMGGVVATATSDTQDFDAGGPQSVHVVGWRISIGDHHVDRSCVTDHG